MKKLLSLICIMLLISCDKENIDLESNPIDSNINIEFRELLGTDSRQLALYCQTDKVYPCVNYPIVTEENYDNNRLNITFTEVLEIDFCYTAIGPATAEIGLPSLETGTYEIELNNANLKNKGTLYISDNKVDIIFKKQKGINIVRQSTQRVPPNTYWGEISYFDEGTTNQANDFLQKVAVLGADFGKQNQGHYVYYEIDKNGDIINNAENSGSSFAKAFIFQYTGDEELLKEQLKEIATAYFDDNMYIYINTYKGERIINWD